MNKFQIDLFKTYLDLFGKKSFANVATVMKDGSPQVSPVWVDFDGDNILINASRGRQKLKNLKRDHRVVISIQYPDNPNRKLIVRGRVVEETEQGADEHINKLAKNIPGLIPTKTVHRI